MKKVWWMGEENIVMREAPSFAHTIYVHYHNLQKQPTRSSIFEHKIISANILLKSPVKLSKNIYKFNAQKYKSIHKK